MRLQNLAIKLIVITVIAISGLILVTQKKADKRTEPREKVSIGNSNEPITALCMIAEEKGYFSANGLDVSVKDYEGGNVAIRDMFEGRLDMSTVADNMVVFNSFKRHDFRIIATIGSSDNEPRIVARRDRGIIKPADLKGKRIATVKGTAVHYFLHLFLMKYGMTKEDVKIVLKDPSSTFKSFTEGEVDAISTREPFVAQGVRHFTDNAVVFAEPRLLVKNYNIIALNSFIKNHPGVVKKTLRALIQAEEFAIAHPQEVVRIVSKRLGVIDTEISPILLEMKWKVFLEQSLLLRLEDQARWMMKDNVVDVAEIPDYYQFIHIDALNSVKPEAVTIIR
ncbi:MAG: ABC transporter substrate-binding protein [Nitrospirae bacterium]|nr:ABC transporter substrate-binding protein [Nitrospirota bacterium]